MSRVGLAVAVVAVLFCVSSVVCEEESSYEDICSGSYRCRGIGYSSRRRSSPANLTVITIDRFDRLYVTASLSGSDCTLSGSYTFFEENLAPQCYVGVRLHTVRVNAWIYTDESSNSEVTFYDDGFSKLLFVEVCDIGDYTNPCGCDDQYPDCSCGITRLFECFPVRQHFVDRIASTCADSFYSSSSGTCD